MTLPLKRNRKKNRKKKRNRKKSCLNHKQSWHVNMEKSDNYNFTVAVRLEELCQLDSNCRHAQKE